MRFLMLGPLEVWDGAEPVRLGGPRVRALLACLLAAPNGVVSADALVEMVWPEGELRGPKAALQVQVGRLRRALEEGLPPRAEGRWVRTAGAGYSVHIGPGELDVDDFQRLRQEGQRALAAGRLHQASRQLHAALELWRGPALADVPVDALHREFVPALNEDRVAAVEQQMSADIGLGAYAAVVDDLCRLVAEHPHRETLRGLCLVALARCGRTSEALRGYEAYRRELRQLGADPGRELQRIWAAILDGRDPAQPRPVRPAQLPPRPTAFTGRAAELRALDKLLTGDGGGSPVAVLSGTPGGGKTAIAVWWANQVLDRFPDGQVYVDLRGYGPDQPLGTEEVLRSLLRALGLADARQPADAADLVSLYRSVLRDQRVLLVLDNAASAEAVRPLLPGGGHCFVLVTSREPLSGLVARDGAHPVGVDLLPEPDARHLVRALVGDRAYADDAAAGRLVELCARLPLAIRIAAERVAAHPGTPLAQLCAELAGERGLDAFAAGGDPYTALRSVFAWSYWHLPAGAQRLFRLLGTQPGRDADIYAAAALAGTGLAEATELLATLSRAHLIAPLGPRYTMHDLLRAYARELATEGDTAALPGLFAYQLYMAGRAASLYAPAEQAAELPPPATPTPALADGSAALRWLDAERANLVASARYGSTPELAGQLSEILFRYLETGGHYHDAEALHTCALDTADPRGRAVALRGQAAVYWRWARYPQAADRYRQALAIAREIGDRDGEYRSLNGLGLVADELADYGPARGYYRQALAIAREIGDELGEGRTLCHLGILDQAVGAYRPAIANLRAALRLARRVGNRVGEGRALSNLGFTCQLLGRYRLALVLDQAALAIAAETGNRGSQSVILGNLGTVHDHLGDPAAALRYCTQALAVAREIGDRQREGMALDSLGQVCDRQGRHAEALAHFRGAVQAGTGSGARQLEVSARNGAGEALLGLGRTGEALAEHRAAAALAAAIGDGPQLARAEAGIARAGAR